MGHHGSILTKLGLLASVQCFNTLVFMKLTLCKIVLFNWKICNWQMNEGCYLGCNYKVFSALIHSIYLRFTLLQNCYWIAFWSNFICHWIFCCNVITTFLVCWSTFWSTRNFKYELFFCQQHIIMWPINNCLLLRWRR